MISKTTERFRKAYAALPEPIRKQAKAAYGRFKENPRHPSLRLKQVHSEKPIYSARINVDYRALAIKEHETYIWFWIGSHSDYDKLLVRL